MEATAKDLTATKATINTMSVTLKSEDLNRIFFKKTVNKCFFIFRCNANVGRDSNGPERYKDQNGKFNFKIRW